MRLLGRYRYCLAGEQALIESGGKVKRAAVAYRPERPHEEPGATTDQPVGPAANARQRGALPDYLQA
jgi:hypothetical protein